MEVLPTPPCSAEKETRRLSQKMHESSFLLLTDGAQFAL